MMALEPVTERTYRLQATAMKGQVILTVQEPGDLIVPTVSVQLPEDIALQIVTAIDRTSFRAVAYSEIEKQTA